MTQRFDRLLTYGLRPDQPETGAAQAAPVLPPARPLPRAITPATLAMLADVRDLTKIGAELPDDLYDAFAAFVGELETDHQYSRAIAQGDTDRAAAVLLDTGAPLHQYTT